MPSIGQQISALPINPMAMDSEHCLDCRQPLGER